VFMMCHGEATPPPPEQTEPCCATAAMTDMESCTCWVDVVWPEPEPDVEHGPSPLRDRLCGDCAFRKDSPERQAIGGDQLPYGPQQVFTCHAGMPKVTARVHAPTGVTVRPELDDYQPVSRGRQSWQADGQPAEICAGWARQNHITGGVPR
jgi:hypothetical protein